MLTIKVESSLGTEIYDVLKEMIEFADKLDVHVTQNVNGIIVLASKGRNVDELYLKYIEARALNRKVVR